MTERVALISIDGHVGPLLVDMRQYCPQEHLEDFDAYAAAVAPLVPQVFGGLTAKAPTDESPRARRGRRILETKGHYDPNARLADIDKEGLAGEVLFHTSQNGEFMPFQGLPADSPQFALRFVGQMPSPTREQQAVGMRIYNRWLVDFCSAAPERFVGLAYIPYWDFEATVKEMEWAREAGLKAVNFPSMRASLPGPANKAWDPIYEASIALDMPLVTHIGGAETPGGEIGPDSPGSIFMCQGIDQVWFGRRGLTWMVVGGVFERHPDLKFVLTELPGAWWGPMAQELDSQFAPRDHPTFGRRANSDSPVAPSEEKDMLLAGLPITRAPSDYMRTNCYLGASFMSRADLQWALQDKWTKNFMWGADYPHMEGTWGFTTQSLNMTFDGVEEEAVRDMAGRNAARVFGLDLNALAPVIEEIGPTIEEITQPFDASTIPEEGLVTLAFRKGSYFS